MCAAVAVLADAADQFAARYAAMLDALLAHGLPTAVCTVYDTPQTSAEARIVRAGLSLFNDAITRAAFARDVPVIDLRLICSDPADYANPIEPSVAGGEKISAAILKAVRDGAWGGLPFVVPR
jgi:hypothetical protein